MRPKPRFIFRTLSSIGHPNPQDSVLFCAKLKVGHERVPGEMQKLLFTLASSHLRFPKSLLSHQGYRKAEFHDLMPSFDANASSLKHCLWWVLCRSTRLQSHTDSFLAVVAQEVGFRFSLKSHTISETKLIAMTVSLEANDPYHFRGVLVCGIHPPPAAPRWAPRPRGLFSRLE
ncbi:hypothetical protein BDP81DRAFT_12383 [Colletotrichum phormii]|uniref:Uncharacterized protein n=1 Tax=Colletotrichum phormii TaxID=359342 RepID=A0AAJ0A3R4_9PEZI|nr:uncharacterized protein BDP81DRAFT_12383 [Colletotrichum phormii]KAK1655925.1 hypothetical protein BDP81DRAFT_12383 [Colletotrichum phormii]